MTDRSRVCENGRHNFGPPPRPPAGVEPMECQCHRLMLGYYFDNGEAFVYVVTSVEAAPTEPKWGRTVDDLVAADLAGAVEFRCMGCGVRVGEDHEPDCDEVSDPSQPSAT